MNSIHNTEQFNKTCFTERKLNAVWCCNSEFVSCFKQWNYKINQLPCWTSRTSNWIFSNTAVRTSNLASLMLTWGSGIAVRKEFSPYLLGFTSGAYNVLRVARRFILNNSNFKHKHASLHGCDAMLLAKYAVALRDCSAFIFKVKEFVVWPWIYGHYDPSKCHRLLACITPLKTCMCNNTIMSPMTLEATCKQGLLQCLWLNTALVGISQSQSYTCNNYVG